ncbi:MAG: hypothetical protein IKU03_01165 [Bacteroidales bacterium]|nr:hypothetical protein [Bacteroidales bacterium]
MQNTYQQIQNLLQSLSEWLDQNPSISLIEKDIILEQMRALYARMSEMTVTTEAAPVAETAPVEPQSVVAPEPTKEEETPKPEAKPELPHEEPQQLYSDHISLEDDVDLFFSMDPHEQAEEPLPAAEEEVELPAEEPVEEVLEQPATTAVEEDDLLHFAEQPHKEEAKPEQPKPVEPKPVEPQPVQPKVEQPKPEQPKPVQPVVEQPKPEMPKVAATPRSLNDLFTDKAESRSVAGQFQQSKVMDLTKAISVNDKFTFIRELFNNKGEEFSAAIQQLNQCPNMDAAFNCLEVLKKAHFWDTTSTAYLSLCDLIRRRYL